MGLLDFAKPRPKRDRSFLYSLWDNIAGVEDDTETPGERLGKGVEAVAQGLLSDPVGFIGSLAKGAEADLNGLMFEGGAMQDPAKVLGYAAAPMAPGAARLASYDPTVANIFAGPKAKTADLGAMERAERMLAQGADREQVWKDTGWFRGVDGKMRFEIDDSRAVVDGERALNERASLNGRESYWPEDYDGVDYSLDRVMTHMPLYHAYPDLRESPVRLLSDKLGYKYKAGYEDAADRFHLSGPVARNDSDFSTGHEVQHGIQGREGFALGGNAESVTPPELTASMQRIDELAKSGAWDGFDDWRNSPEGRKVDPYSRQVEVYMSEINPNDTAFRELKQLEAAKDKLDAQAHENYRRLAGEVEARNVQARRNMNAAERRATPPWATQDVPDEQQIIRGLLK